jgi:superfamily II DNA or RNA helicase
MSYPVGSLVRARGREWVVLPETDDDMLMVRPVGGSEEETTGLLLSLEGGDVEPAIFPLPDPADAGDFRSSRLLRDALRLGFRASAGPFRSFGRIAVSPRPYQLVPLLMALKLDPVRMLIADDVGIGKTVESLLVARELLDQGDVSRLTVLCSPQLAEQWQREMRDKFHIHAELVLPSTVRRLERRLATSESLFDVYPFTVVSTDYIKSDRRRDDFLRAAPELVIVDEAHTCVEATTQGRGGRHQRYALLKGLAADEQRHLLLVTATPHSGNEHAFRALLGLLDPALEQLPDDLTGDQHERTRRQLAQHFVQRRRADIRSYLDEDTTFPSRETSEVTYRLHADYAGLFDRCLELARETALDASGGAHRQRVRWWSALALLRSLASSPAAAAATLRNRAAAADAATVTEADDIGRRTVLDLAEDDAAEAADVPPGSDPDEPDDDQRFRRRLRALANDAEAITGNKDVKLANATTMVKELIKDGFDPILFCRFIPTAEYVADHLRSTLGSKVSVASVTGTLPPDEREARVEALGKADGRKVLVATDCMSEGINLQQHFDAVIHYDLSWNPTRHEQREGRVDRFNQPSPTVRTVTYYGEDNRIDRIVLDVLLRKHERIRSSLGISVPVPGNSDQVVEAIMEGLITREDRGEQLVIEETAKEEQRTLFAAWEDAAEREKRSRTMFAQRGIQVDEVARELDAVRRAIGSDDRVGGFVTEAARELGATVAERDGAVHLEFEEAPRTVKDLLGPDWQTLTARFDPPPSEGETYLSRTHPLVEQLAQHVLETALDPQTDGIATRCGAMRTSAVTTRTTLLLVRFRFNLTQTSRDDVQPLLAEDARVLAFTGSPQDPTWLHVDDAEALFAARPEANVGPDQASAFVGRVLDGWEHLGPHLETVANQLTGQLLDQHRRVRDAARRKGVRFDAEPHLPPDVLGAYVLLPTGGA